MSAALNAAGKWEKAMDKGVPRILAKNREEEPKPSDLSAADTPEPRDVLASCFHSAAEEKEDKKAQKKIRKPIVVVQYQPGPVEIIEDIMVTKHKNKRNRCQSKVRRQKPRSSPAPEAQAPGKDPGAPRKKEAPSTAKKTEQNPARYSTNNQTVSV